MATTNTTSKNQNNKEAQKNAKKSTPMIIERVNKIPMVKMAVTMGFSQYDKLKTSNVTVGELMTRAEGWAAYVWSKFQPIVEKLPISRGDQLACSTLDFVEDKLKSVLH